MSFSDYGGVLALLGDSRRVRKPGPEWVARLVAEGKPCPPKFGGYFYVLDGRDRLFVARCNRRYNDSTGELAFRDRSLDRVMLPSGRHAFGEPAVLVVARCDEEGNPYSEPLLEQPPLP